MRRRAKRAIIASLKRDASRGSPRSLAAQKRLAQDDKLELTVRELPRELMQ